MSLTTFVLLARLLEPEEFGLVAFAASLSAMLELLVNFGIPKYIVQAAEVDRVVRSTVFWTSLGLGLVVCLVQIAAAPVAARWLGEPSVIPVVQVLAIGYPISALRGVTTALFQRDLRFRPLAIRSLVAVLASAAAAIALALAGFGVWALVAQVLVYNLASVVILWISDPWAPGMAWSSSVFRDAFRYGSRALAAAAMDTAATEIQPFVVGRRLGVDALGYFAVANRLVAAVLDLLVSVVLTVAFPIMARTRDDPSLLSAAYSRGVRLAVLVASGAIAILAAQMPQVLAVVFGDKWVPAAATASILAVARVLLVPAWFDSALLYATDRVNYEMWLSALGLLMVAAAVVVGSTWGLEGVAIGLLVRSILLLPIRVGVSCKLTGASFYRLMLSLGRSWTVAALAGAAAFAAGGQVDSGLVSMLLGSAVGGLVWIAACGLVCRDDLRYIVTALRNVARLGRHERSGGQPT